MHNAKPYQAVPRTPASIPMCCILFSLLITAACGKTVDIGIRDARINTAPPAAAVTAGYLTIDNRSAEEVVLVQVSSEDYARIEMHRTEITDGIARMVPRQAVAIPPGTVLEFRPGDYHLMLYRDAGHLQEGETVVLSLRFADGTIIDAEAIVTPVQAQHHH